MSYSSRKDNHTSYCTAPLSHEGSCWVSINPVAGLPVSPEVHKGLREWAPTWAAKNLSGGGGGSSSAHSYMADGTLVTARDRLFGNHDKLCKGAKALMDLKNADYATVSDPYRNFRSFGALGILVRMSDKTARLRNYVENGSFAVKSEGLWDTAMDLVNYTNILVSFLEEEAAAAPGHAEAK